MEKCNICPEKFKTKQHLSAHIGKVHNKQEYYDNFIKKGNEDICKICGKKNEFKSLAIGYRKGCCKNHVNKIAYESRKEKMLKHYGVENQFQRKETKEQIKKTFLKRYGVKHQMLLKRVKDKIKKTNIKRYGVEHNFSNKSPSRKKWEKRLKNKEGITNVFQRKEIKEQIKKTCLERYGVENPMQNIEIFTKSFKTKFKIHKYKDTNLTYQGSYELEFLEKYYNKIDIENGPSIPYLFEGKNKVYHSDFYIPSKNLIVEIKSRYTLKLDEEVYDKENVCLDQGFNYIRILDKKYEEFKRNYCPRYF